MYHTILLCLDPVLHLDLTLLAESQGRSVEQLAIAVLTTYQEGAPAGCVPCQDQPSDLAPAPLAFNSITPMAPVRRPAGRRRKEKRTGPRRNR